MRFEMTPDGLRMAKLRAESMGVLEIDINGRRETVEDAEIILRQSERTIRKWIMKENANA